MTNRLTTKQAAFIDAYLASAETGRPDPCGAARRAGYSTATAEHARRDVLESQAVQAELERRLGDVEAGGHHSLRQAIPAALSTLIAVATKGASESARVTAAREILDRTGLTRSEGKSIATDSGGAALVAQLARVVQEVLPPEQCDRLLAALDDELGD